VQKRPLIMEHHDTVDRTIRNQRPRGWTFLFWLGAWGLIWMGGAVAVELWLSPPKYTLSLGALLWLIWLIPMLASYFLLLFQIGRLPPTRLKLGDNLQLIPGPTVPPKNVRGFRFERDPEEDYIESSLPIPRCQLAIDLGRRTRKMIVSLGDASRAAEWAEQHGVPVVDPQGYASRIHVPETRQ